MSTWFSCNLGDAMLAGEPLDNIKTLFLSEYEKANSSKTMAVFFRHESEGRLHCEVKVYFSPQTAVVAKAANAVPCEKPLPGGLGLLVGPIESWSTLFPENNN
jgi:hypothetical protein